MSVATRISIQKVPESEVIVFEGTSVPVLCNVIVKSGDTENDNGGGKVLILVG